MSRYTDGNYLLQNPGWHAQDARWKLTHVLRAVKAARLFPRSVLDAGCGAGALINHWAHHHPEMRFTGCDISPQAISLAKQHAPENVNFLCEAWADGTFDAALAIDVIEHVLDMERFLGKLAQKAPVLILHVPLDLSFRTLIKPEILEEEYQTVGHIHFFTARYFKRLLKKRGWQILHAHYTNKYVERPPKLVKLKSRIGMCIRLLAHYLLPRSWVAFWVGGYSLMLVVKTK